MAPSLTKAETEHGPVFTGHNANTTGVTVFDTIPPGVVAPELRDAYLALQAETETLMDRVEVIVHESHPDRVSDQIAAAITKIMKSVITKLIAVGVRMSRDYQEIWDRLGQPTPATSANSAIRADYRRVLLDSDGKGQMQLLGRDAPIELLAAAIEIHDVLGIPADFFEDVQRRFVLANLIKTHALAADSALVPTPDKPFQHGVDMAKVTEMAETMITARQASLDALDSIEAATGRLITMLGVVAEKRPDQIWTLVTGK